MKAEAVPKCRILEPARMKKVKKKQKYSCIIFISCYNVIWRNVIMSIPRERENELLGQILAYLDETHSKESKSIKEEFSCLENLKRVALHYPDMRSVWKNGELLDSVLGIVPSSNRLYTLPRVANTHSFLVTKLHVFSMLFSMLKEIDAFHAPLRASMFSIICIFMAERVYASCLQDNTISKKIKEVLADDLVSLWDYAIDPKHIRFSPFLEQLWMARNSSPPSFGTMDGNSEILRLSIEMIDPTDWINFIKKQQDDQDDKDALLEFVFGLSHEDIQKERDRLQRAGILAVGENDFGKIFGAMKPAYTSIKSSDPRTFYNFFIERHNQAVFRRRVFIDGPKRTIEESYLEYLVSKI
jgi:hypothetical protein